MKEQDPATALTTREQEVLVWLGKGCTNRQIAEKLFISEETVKVHVKNILRKLGVNNRTGAALKIRRLG